MEVTTRRRPGRASLEGGGQICSPGAKREDMQANMGLALMQRRFQSGGFADGYAMLDKARLSGGAPRTRIRGCVSVSRFISHNQKIAAARRGLDGSILLKSRLFLFNKDIKRLLRLAIRLWPIHLVMDSTVPFLSLLLCRLPYITKQINYFVTKYAL